MSKRYAIKVKMGDDWVYVTEDQLTNRTERDYIGFGMIYPVLFENFWEAEEASGIWRKDGDTTDDFVKVVEYTTTD